ncbi:MAG: amidohydrolase [Firmicutes bacterium]|nr:amidohydrolase [Bacillota bacterium]
MDKKVLEQEIISWRHDIHQHPEAAFEEERTAEFVAEKLREFGYEVEEHVGKTGVVGVLKNGDGPIIGLRADMDANKIIETGDVAWKSQTEQRMHACGHDGHTATLLGAAKLIADEKAFKGTVVLVFQPAEEPGWGADAMLKDGLMERYPMQEIYGQHNFTYYPAGTMSIPVGPCMAAEDDFIIQIHGKGGHASGPHVTKDPIVIGAEIVTALQTIVSRNVNPLRPAVVSCTEFITDGAPNAIPSNVTIKGDCRSYDPALSQLIEERMRKIVQSICEMNEAAWEVEYSREFIATINDRTCADWAAKAAEKVFGKENVDLGCDPIMGSEDFAKYQQLIPGCYCFTGNVDAIHDKPNHHACYDYNDAILLPAAEWFAELVRVRMA